MTPDRDRSDFDLVLIGANLGIYALARAFHEQYGIRSTVVSYLATGPIMRSDLLDNVEIGADGSLENILETLLRLGRERTHDRPVVLLANADGFIQFMSDHRDELEQYYLMSIPEAERIAEVSDKARFAELCTSLDINTPTTFVQDFADADEPGWAPMQVEIPFPVVAKPAASSAYEGMSFPGRKKVYFVQSQAELEEIFGRIRDAGFRGRFVVQELIEGADTAMRSITAYCDRNGTVTMLCSAHVLLEEHSPLGLGNPAAMITTQLPEATEQAIRLLQHVDYVGFANFDLKMDPRDGTIRFLELNPRIGRNNHYVTAAGANVSRFIVEDVVHGHDVEPVVVDREVLYTVLPLRLILRYVTDPELRRWVKQVARRGIANPLRYRADNLWRRWYVVANKANHVKKFVQYYPKPTSTGF